MTRTSLIPFLVVDAKRGSFARTVLLFLLMYCLQFPDVNAQSADSASDKPVIDSAYSNLFRIAFSACRFEDAMEYSKKYYEAALQKNDEDEIFNSLKGMFALNRQMGNYENSFYYAQKLYDIALKAGNKRWAADALWGLAELYTLTENYAVALSYYRKAGEIENFNAKQYPADANSGMEFYMELAELYSQMNRFDSAWTIYINHKPLSESQRGIYLLSTGECYFQQGDFKQALENYRQALDILVRQNRVYDVMRALLDVAKVYAVLDNHRAALSYGQQGLQIALRTRVNRYVRDGYLILSDAYGGLNLQDSSNFYFRKYVLVKDAVLNDQTKGKFAAYTYEQQISLMSKEKQIQDIRLQKQTLMKNILAVAIIGLLLFAFIFSRNILLTRRNEARKRQLAENELQIQKLETEKSKAEMLHQKSELEMKALRAQMNPHFIFNCLNAINRFIIRNDAEKAADYLTKFAKLIRIVLEKSGQPYIPLGEDLYCLQLYMDLEAIRFEKPFVYEIHCQGIDKSTVLVPSLLMQPFVENAIWHGLHPIQDRQGRITIHLNVEKDLLHCTICDNGVGRKKSNILKENGLGTRKSLGIELTRQRLQLSDPLKQDNAMVIFEDLKDGTGKNTGTCVQINIPVKKV
jgi:tetratricopeptide (TPR) repeat protein